MTQVATSTKARPDQSPSLASHLRPKIARGVLEVVMDRFSPRLVKQANRYGHLSARGLAILPQLRADICPQGFADLFHSHQGRVHPGRAKYLDLDTWLGRHVTHAEAIGLLDSPPRRILDIGTGNGYFPFICRRFGHDVVATDVDSVELYDDLVSLLGIRRVVNAVETFRPLPDFGDRFDLVTAFNVVFDRIDDTTTWTPKEWGFFLEDLRDHVLRPEGQIVIKLNPHRGRHQDVPALVSFFRSLGADVATPFVEFCVAGGRFVKAGTRMVRRRRTFPKRSQAV